MKSNLSRIPRLYSAEAVLAEAALDKEQQDRQARKNNTWVEFSSSKPHVVFLWGGLHTFALLHGAMYRVSVKPGIPSTAPGTPKIMVSGQTAYE